MRKKLEPHPPGHLARGGALQEPHDDNRSRGGLNKKRNLRAARNLAAVPRVTDPWATLKR